MSGTQEFAAAVNQNVRSLMLLFALCVSVSCFAQRFDDDYLEPINGTKLHFRVRGEDKRNPYLLILHGGPGATAINFYPWGERLESRVNVVYLDQRGSGLSERPKFKDPAHPTAEEARDFSIDTFIHDIEGVRKMLGIKSWYVLGHSFGGLLGTYYVDAFSEHVRGFIDLNGLVSVPMINQDWLDYADSAVKKTAAENDPKEKERVADVLANISVLRTLPPKQLDEQLYDKVLSKIWPERIRDRLPGANEYDQLTDEKALKRYNIPVSAMGSQGIGAAFNVNDRLFQREAIPLYKGIRTPTIIISGRQDPIIPPKRLAMVHQMIPNSRIEYIDQADHESFKQQPDKIASVVLGFVVRTERAASHQK